MRSGGIGQASPERVVQATRIRTFSPQLKPTRFSGWLFSSDWDMPEGDTIRKLCTALRPVLVGEVILRSRARFGIRCPVAGQSVIGVDSRGKHLLIQLASGAVLRTHLGMYGSWHWYRPGERWRKPERQASVVLETADRILVCFNAKEVQWLDGGSFQERDFVHGLGPDLIADPFDARGIIDRVRALSHTEASLADLLLDQRIACGLGNVYKSEVLFLGRMAPDRSVSEIPDRVLVRLYRIARILLGRNLGAGPRVTRFAEDGRGRLWVYRRRGLPCLRCGTAIAAGAMGRDRRSTYWCPSCQRVPASAGDHSRR